jgi:transcriptional regulator with XRE-family HTH domain
MDHNMSQTQLATALGLALRTIQGIELGEHRPSYTSRLRFHELRKRHEKAEKETPWHH